MESYEEREIKRRTRTYKSTNPTKIIQDGWCHQCKIKQTEVLACVNFWKNRKNKKCNGKYCPKCIDKHYNEDFLQLKEQPEWICYSCQYVCKCASCKRKRGSYVNRRKNLPIKNETEEEDAKEYYFESTRHCYYGEDAQDQTQEGYDDQQGYDHVAHQDQQHHYEGSHLFPQQGYAFSTNQNYVVSQQHSQNAMHGQHDEQILFAGDVLQSMGGHYQYQQDQYQSYQQYQYYQNGQSGEQSGYPPSNVYQSYNQQYTSRYSTPQTQYQPIRDYTSPHPPLYSTHLPTFDPQRVSTEETSTKPIYTSHTPSNKRKFELSFLMNNEANEEDTQETYDNAIVSQN